MLVTVLADASHCPDMKVAGYGYWIASNRGKLGGGGMMKGTVETSTLAEMQAIANALYEGIKNNLIQVQDSVLFQTDCQAAIFAFSGQRRITDEEQKVVNYFQGVLDRFELKAEMRHVKGHTSRKEARFVTNNMCDKRAKKSMKRARILQHIKQCREVLDEAVS